MNYDEKEQNDALHGDQDEVGGTDKPRFAEEQQGTGEPGADIPEQGDGDAKDD